MNIQKINIEQLKPAPYNPRKSNKKQEEHLKKSLEKFGVVEPIVYNKRTGYIVGGHFRVRELKKLGYTEVDCVVVDLSEEDEKELNVRLNANTGEWDFDLLESWDKTELAEWGLNIPEFENIDLDYSSKNKEIDIDDLNSIMLLKLKFSEKDYFHVKQQLSEIASTPEQAVWKLLGNE